MADLYVCSHGATNPCDECKATRLALMFAMRKELDPDAPDMIMFPESTQSLPNENIERFNSYVPDMHGQRMGMCLATDGEYIRYSDHERIVKELTSEREQIARIIERMYGPHDRKFKTAIEIADAIRKGK